MTPGLLLRFSLQICVVLCGFQGLIPCVAQQQWTTSGRPTTDMKSACALGGNWYAVGENGALHKSADGLEWTVIHPLTGQTLNRVASANGTLVAVGNGGTILTSTNGTTWLLRDSGTSDDLRDITYGLGAWIACGGGPGSNVLLRSSDLITWSAPPLTLAIGSTYTPQAFTSVCLGGTKFLLVGEGSLTAYSTDGLVWEQTLITHPGWMSAPTRAIYGNGKFLVLGNQTYAVTANNSFGWTTYHGNGMANWKDAIYLNNRYFLVGTDASTGGECQITPFTDNGSVPSGIEQAGAHAIATDGTKVLALGLKGKSVISDDLLSWRVAPFAVRDRVIFDGTQYLHTRSGILAKSSDGIHWTQGNFGLPLDSSSYPFTSTRLSFVNGRYFATGRSGVATSTDAINWVKATSYSYAEDDATPPLGTGPTGFTIIGSGTLTLNGGLTFQLGTTVGSGTLTLAPGGVWPQDILNFTVSSVQPTFQLPFLNLGSGIDKIVYGNGRYVATVPGYIGIVDGQEYGGALAQATDPLAWTFLNTNNDYFDVAFGGGKFVAVGGDATQFRSAVSTDGVTWTEASKPDRKGGVSIAYGNGIFVAVQMNGNIRTSPDGVNWSSRGSTSLGSRQVRFADGMFVVTGTTSDVARSLNGIDWINIPFVSGGEGFGNPVFNGSRWYLPGATPVLATSNLKAANPAAPQWQPLSPYQPQNLKKVLRVNGLWFAIQEKDLSSSNLFSSADGVQWTFRLTTTSPLMDLGFQGGTYLAVASDTAYTSTNLSNWTQRTPSTASGAWYNAVAVKAGLFVIAGSTNVPTLFTSPNGTTWTARTAGFNSGFFLDIAYGNGKFLAVGFAGKFATSSDGLSWSGAYLDEEDFFNVAAVETGFLAAQSNRALFTANGSQWTGLNGVAFPSAIDITGVGTAGAALIDTEARAYFTADGAQWHEQFPGTPVRSIAYDGAGTFLAVSMGGRLLTSGLSTPLAAPTGFACLLAGDTYLDLDWNPVAGVAGYVLETLLEDGEWSSQQTIDPSLSATRITGLLPKSQHYFRLRAIHATGGSDFVPLAGNVSTRRRLEEWRRVHFGSIQDGGLGANLATGAGDTVPNLVKYALLMNPAALNVPLSPTTAQSVVGAQNRAVTTFTLQRSALRSDVNLYVQYSPDLGDWHTVARSLAGAPFQAVPFAVPAGTTLDLDIGESPHSSDPGSTQVQFSFDWLSNTPSTGYYRVTALEVE